MKIKEQTLLISPSEVIKFWKIRRKDSFVYEQLLSQYVHEAYGHKQRKRHPRIIWKLENTVSKL